MVDIYSREKRSEIMSKVRSTNTKPERIVRKKLHASGFRFRLNRKDLPGKPDIVLPKYKTVILVHGCFWHQHEDCPKSKLPSTNEEFWKMKLTGNLERDKRNIKELKKLGWRILVIWECEVKKGNYITKLDKFFRGIDKKNKRSNISNE